MIGEVHDMHVWFVWNSYFLGFFCFGRCVYCKSCCRKLSLSSLNRRMCTHVWLCVYACVFCAYHVIVCVCVCSCIYLYVCHIWTSIPLLTNAARGEVLRGGLTTMASCGVDSTLYTYRPTPLPNTRFRVAQLIARPTL